jgi:hypothetical protein
MAELLLANVFQMQDSIHEILGHNKQKLYSTRR